MTKSRVFRVWAPSPGRVELVLGEQRIAMDRAEDGWWSASAEEPEDGAYAFALDGGPALPDPRSAWQPDGIHGASRIVDHQAFVWNDQGFVAERLSAAVIYELHVGTFTPAGTFRGVVERLDHLVSLGVTHLELMPLNEFSGRHGWGYDGVDLFAPHHAYGSPNDLKQLVDACHARGLAVLLDVVYNHLGPAGNYLDRFGPYFTDRYHTPWGKAVNLDDCDSDEVRRFFCDNAAMWLEDYHFDGLRIDAVHAFADHSAVHFLEQLRNEVTELSTKLGRKLVLIAESDLNDQRIVRSPELGGFGLDAQWSDDFHHALHTALTGETRGYYADFDGLADLAKALSSVFVYDGKYSRSRRRRHGRPATGAGGRQFLAYAQTHDQVGNRMFGERTSQLVSPRLLELTAAFVLTAPFIPMLFQGEEWGASTPFLYFTDHEDAALGRAVSDGRRREFESLGLDPERVPDPQSPDTFRRCVLNWDEVGTAHHAGLLGLHRELIALRRRTPELLAGQLDVRPRFSERERWLCFERGPLSVIGNFGQTMARVPLAPERPRRLLIGGADAVGIGSEHVELPGQSVVVLGP